MSSLIHQARKKYIVLFDYSLCFSSVFLNRINGNRTLPNTENPQTIKVAISQVERPEIDIPSVIKLVINKPIKVVTSAIPPIK